MWFVLLRVVRYLSTAGVMCVALVSVSPLMKNQKNQTRFMCRRGRRFVAESARAQRPTQTNCPSIRASPRKKTNHANSYSGVVVMLRLQPTNHQQETLSVNERTVPTNKSNTFLHKVDNFFVIT